MRRLPLVLLATLTVLGVPLAAVTLLRTSGAIDSFLPLAAAGAALSIAISYAGAALWAARAGSGDTVFGDLMIWGWLRRRRQERKLASAVRLLGLSDAGGPPELDRGRRVRLLEQLATGLEARYPDTSGHSRRVARHAAAIAQRMGLPGEEVDRIRAAAALHDVGKIDTPAEIVNKPGALSEEEFAAIKRHAAAGAGMVAPLGDEQLTRIVRHHHERPDGGGYPDGLAGTAIPLGARIVAVADTFDAVTSDRPYRPARRHREALALLEAEAGAQLDADAVEAFCGYYSGLRPVAAWAALLNGARGLLPSLAGQAKLGGAVAATTLAVAAGGGLTSQAGTGERTSTGGAAAESAARLASFGDSGGGADSQRTPAGRRAGAAEDAGDGGGTGASPEPSDSAAGEGAGERLAQVPGSGSDGGARGSGSRDGGGSSGGGRGPGDGEEDDPPLVREAADTVTATADTVTATADTVTATADRVTASADRVTASADTVVDGVESTIDSTLDDPPVRVKEAPAVEAPLGLGG